MTLAIICSSLYPFPHVSLMSEISSFMTVLFNSARSILYFDNFEGDISVNEVLFQNTSGGDSTSYFKIGQSRTLTANSLIFLDCNPINSNDLSNYLINLEELSFQVDGNITFNNLSVRNTTLAVLKISNHLQSKEIVQNITFNDLEIKDSGYLFSTKVIKTENIRSNNSFKIIFNRMIIENLYFKTPSSIMALNHQCEQALEINDSIIRNVTFGIISISETGSSYEIKPLVKISNLTATNNDAVIW